MIGQLITCCILLKGVCRFVTITTTDDCRTKYLHIYEDQRFQNSSLAMTYHSPVIITSEGVLSVGAVQPRFASQGRCTARHVLQRCMQAWHGTARHGVACPVTMSTCSCPGHLPSRTSGKQDVSGYGITNTTCASLPLPRDSVTGTHHSAPALLAVPIPRTEPINIALMLV